MFQLISHSFAVVTITNKCRTLYFFTGKRLQSGLCFYSLSSASKDTTQSLHPQRNTYFHNAGVERQQKHHVAGQEILELFSLLTFSGSTS